MSGGGAPTPSDAAAPAPRSPLSTVGLAYTTLSAAALPAGLVVLAVMLAGFRENGPQSQGALGLATVLAVASGAALLNTVVALALAIAVVGLRPRPAPVAWTTGGLLAGAGLLFALLRWCG